MKITKEELKQIIEEVLKEADDTVNPIGKGGSSWWEKTGRMRPHYTSHGADYERYEPTYRMTPEHPDHPDHVPQPSRRVIDRRRCYRAAETAVYGRHYDGSLDLKSGDPKHVEIVFQTCLEFQASGKIKEYDALDRHFKDEPWYKDYRARSDEMQKVKPSLRQYATEGKTKLTTSTLKELVKKTISEMDETMDSGYMPPKDKPKKKSKLKEELPMQDYTLDLPPGAVEVTDLEEKVKNFLSTKAYTKAGLDDAGRADFVRSHHKEFTQFVLNGEVYHIYGDQMFNSADEEIDPYQIAENIYSKQANMPLEDEADDIIADAGTDDVMSLLDGLPPDEKLEIINMLMGDLYQANPELADEFDRMKGPS